MAVFECIIAKKIFLFTVFLAFILQVICFFQLTERATIMFTIIYANHLVNLLWQVNNKCFLSSIMWLAPILHYILLFHFIYAATFSIMITCCAVRYYKVHRHNITSYWNDVTFGLSLMIVFHVFRCKHKIIIKRSVNVFSLKIISSWNFTSLNHKTEVMGPLMLHCKVSLALIPSQQVEALWDHICTEIQSLLLWEPVLLPIN